MMMALINLALICFAFHTAYYYPDSLLLGISVLCISLAYTYYNLRKVFSIDDLKNWFRKKE